jgi:hypothetical protein
MMPEPNLLKFTLAITDFDVSLLSLDARQHGTPEFCDSVTAYFNDPFERFGGSNSIQVGNDVIEVNWTTDEIDAHSKIADVPKPSGGRSRDGSQQENWGRICRPLRLRDLVLTGRSFGMKPEGNVQGISVPGNKLCVMQKNASPGIAVFVA